MNITQIVAIASSAALFLSILGYIYTFADRKKLRSKEEREEGANNALVIAEMRADIKSLLRGFEKLEDIPGRMLIVEEKIRRLEDERKAEKP